MTSVKSPKQITQAALAELESTGSLSKASANELLTISGPTEAYKMYVRHALDQRGELTPNDMMSLAVLTQPIEVPTNKELQRALNTIREKGVVEPADADALFNSIGKLSSEEHNQITHLLQTIMNTPGVSDDVMQELIDRREPFLAQRQTETAGFHKSIQKKTWATYAAAMLTFVGILNIPGASEVAQTLAQDVEVLGSLLHFGAGLAGAMGAGVMSRRVMDPGADLAAIETYGIHDLDEITDAISNKTGADLEAAEATVKEGVLALFEEAGVKAPKKKDLGSLERHLLKKWDTVAAHLVATKDQTPTNAAQAAVQDAIKARWA